MKGDDALDAVTGLGGGGARDSVELEASDDPELTLQVSKDGATFGASFARICFGLEVTANPGLGCRRVIGTGLKELLEALFAATGSLASREMRLKAPPSMPARSSSSWVADRCSLAERR